MNLAIQPDLETKRIACAPETLLKLCGSDKALSVEQGRIGRSKSRGGNRDPLKLECVIETIPTDVEMEFGVFVLPSKGATDGIEVVHRPEVQQIDVIAPEHSTTHPDEGAASIQILNLNECLSDGDFRFPTTVVVHEAIAIGDGHRSLNLTFLLLLGPPTEVELHVA